MKAGVGLSVVALVAIHIGFVAASTQADDAAVCTSIGLDPPRSWRFEKQGQTWQVSHWRGSDQQRAVTLAMPANARARLIADTLDFKARTSNGGIDVTLTGRPDEARLDIYVSYELEVNVDASLTPSIDDLNTEGPVGVRCRLSPR